MNDMNYTTDILTAAIKFVVANKLIEELHLQVDASKLLETWDRIADEEIDKYLKLIENKIQEKNNETKHENPENSGT